MHIFVLVVLIGIFTWPYMAIREIVNNAASSNSSRVNSRKDVLISVLPAIYMFVLEKNVFYEEAIFNLNFYVNEFGALSFVLYSITLFIAIQFIRIAFGDGGWDLRISRVLMFVFAYIGVGIFISSRPDLKIFGYHLIYIILWASGFLFFVFFAGIHSVFSKLVLLFNVGGFVASIADKGKLFYEDYFLMLDLLPEVSGGFGLALIIGSTLLSAHNSGVERGWFQPLVKI